MTQRSSEWGELSGKLTQPRNRQYFPVSLTFMKFQILMAANIKITVFCNLIGSYQRFGQTFSLCLQDRILKQQVPVKRFCLSYRSYISGGHNLKFYFTSIYSEGVAHVLVIWFLNKSRISQIGLWTIWIYNGSGSLCDKQLCRNIHVQSLLRRVSREDQQFRDPFSICSLRPCINKNTVCSDHLKRMFSVSNEFPSCCFAARPSSGTGSTTHGTCR
jgi:hypothetical protein